MIPRRPNIELETAPFVWTRVPEVSHYWHGASVSAPHVEPYLIKVMRLASAKIDNHSDKLKRELEIFIQQESNHYRFHITFNKRLHQFGCARLKPLEDAFKADFQTMIESKSLEFNMAYCAGFENFSMYSALFVYGPGADIFDGADPRGADLLKWHLAEEFEHRSVCHDVFNSVSGNYFIRVYGVLYSFCHLNSFIDKATAIVMGVHREGMAKDERKASVRRERSFKLRIGLYVLPRIFLLLLPFYNPARYKTPSKISEALNYYNPFAESAT